eukprot:143095-Prorocentrum_minimum.AAC.1
MRTRHVGKTVRTRARGSHQGVEVNPGVGDGTLPATHQVGPRKGPLEEGLRTTATHEPATEIRISIRKRRGKAAKN